MNMQTNIPSAGNLLAQRAMLAGLTISQWSARKTDKRATREVHAAHNARDDAGRYNKALVARSALEGIAAVASEARGEHYRLTLPWLDNGARILPAKNFLEYSNIMRGLRERFEAAAAEFSANYSQFVDDARRSLGDLFDANDYPDERKISRAFDFGTRILPMPTAGDFRVEIGEAQADDMRRQIEAATAEALAGAQRDAWERIAKVVGAMVDRLSAYQPGEKGQRAQGTFRDSLCQNVRDLVAVLPAFNIVSDPALTAIISRMERELCAHDAEDLRTNETARTATAQAAASILAEVSDFLS